LSTGYGAIALYLFLAERAPCSNINPTCDFESDINSCGWKFERADPDIEYDWHVASASTSPSRAKIDHTTGTMNGHFAESGNVAPFNSITYIVSARQFGANDKVNCLSFWFWRLTNGLSGPTEDVLEVALFHKDKNLEVSIIKV